MDERSVSFEHLLNLAHRRALDGKGGLAASVTKICLDSGRDLSQRELDITYDILRMLIDKVEVTVRRGIADYLGPRDDVPKDLIAFLANDTVNVAYPILRDSPLLDEFDLVRIISDHGTGHAIAVAGRNELPEGVCSHLIAMDESPIDLALAKNDTAQVGIAGMSILVDRAVENAELHDPLSRRADLGDELARRLYTVVGEALRQHIVQNFDIDGAVVTAAIDDAVLKALDDPDPIGKALSGGWSNDEAMGRTSVAAQILSRLNEQGPEAAALIFADHTRLPLATARWVFQSGNPQLLAIAMKSTGMDIDAFAGVIEQLGLQDETDMQNLLSYFDRIDGNTATMVVRSWKNRPPQG